MAYSNTTKSTGGRLQNIGVAVDAIEYSSFAADIDVTNLTPGAPAAAGFMVTVAGTNQVQVVTATGQTRTYDTTNLVGVRMDVAIRTIKGTTTTVGKLIVFLV